MWLLADVEPTEMLVEAGKSLVVNCTARGPVTPDHTGKINSLTRINPRQCNTLPVYCISLSSISAWFETCPIWTLESLFLSLFRFRPSQCQASTTVASC